MSARIARLLTQMLRRVVTHGTATAANLPGLDIAGKTGTAPVGGAGRDHEVVASFIGFAPAAHPRVAIAVVLAAPHGGFGGTDAAPVAARVIGDVLRRSPVAGGSGRSRDSNLGPLPYQRSALTD